MKDNKKVRQSFSHMFKNDMFLLKKIWSYTPSFIIIRVILSVLGGIISAAGIIFTKEIFDRLGEGATFSELLPIIIIYLMVTGVYYMFNIYQWRYYYSMIVYKLSYGLHEEMFRKAMTLDLSCFDDPEFFNDYVWAMDASHDRAINIVNDIARIVYNIMSSVTVLGVLFSIDAYLALIILTFTLVRLYFQNLQNKFNHKRAEELNPLERKSAYINRVFYLADASKELRISRISDNILNEYDDNVEKIKNTYKKYGKKLYPANQISSFLYIACDCAVLILMLYELMVTKRVALGGFAAGISATWRLSWMIKDIVEKLIKFPEHSLYIEKIKTFLAYEPKIVSGTVVPMPFKNLEIKNASFGYNDTTVLKNINIRISRGEKIAFVGYNGAGKTTLIKLLMRLYDTNEGEVLYNGRNIKDYDLKKYRSHIGALFQDYKVFAATIAENVLADVYTEDKKDDILKALEYSTFTEKLQTLKDGIETELTREFFDSGTNLSGGETQKIAIARVFVNEHDLIIMDEPSASLDPMAEYKLNHSILDFASDKTVIFISHRLSTTRMADRIYMFENGEMIESGKHDELMAQKGKYAYMFNLQAENYN